MVAQAMLLSELPFEKGCSNQLNEQFGRVLKMQQLSESTRKGYVSFILSFVPAPSKAFDRGSQGQHPKRCVFTQLPHLRSLSLRVQICATYSWCLLWNAYLFYVAKVLPYLHLVQAQVCFYRPLKMPFLIL